MCANGSRPRLRTQGPTRRSHDPLSNLIPIAERELETLVGRPVSCARAENLSRRPISSANWRRTHPPLDGEGGAGTLQRAESRRVKQRDLRPLFAFSSSLGYARDSSGRFKSPGYRFCKACSPSWMRIARPPPRPGGACPCCCRWRSTRPTTTCSPTASKPAPAPSCWCRSGRRPASAWCGTAPSARGASRSRRRSSRPSPRRSPKCRRCRPCRCALPSGSRATRWRRSAWSCA